VPPTNNLINPDEQSVGFDLVPINAKERTIRNVLSNSFGFGGTNASLLLGSVD
jgi:3-oxoacyl-[acyl-carrier-protein] synthase II